jgi:hypothetical protein
MEPNSDDPLGKGILPNIKFYCPIDEDQLVILAKSLDELGRFVLISDNFATLSVEGIVDVGIAPPSNHDAVHEWARTKNLTHPPVEGPPIQTDEVQRAIRKIFDDEDKTAKKWQIPDDGPGVVVLDTNKNLILWTHDIRYVVGALEESLLKEPKINCIVLTLVFATLAEAGTAMQRVGKHLVTHNSKPDGSQEYAVLIRNPSRKTPLSEATERRLRMAFGSLQDDFS